MLTILFFIIRLHFIKIMPPTPLPIHQQIIRLRMKDNLSIGLIAEIVNMSKSVVHGILKVWNDYGSSEARKSISRPRITTKREDRAMVKLAKKDRYKTATAASGEMSIQLGKNFILEDCVSSVS